MSAPAASHAPGSAVARDAAASRPPGRPTALLVVNPRASRAGGVDAAAIARRLASGLDVRTEHTQGRGHAAELAREALAAGCDVVAVVGGDGTVSEVAGGLAGSTTALACLPAGCTNVFARCVGTPPDPGVAADRLAARAAGGPLALRAVDLGTVNGRPFLATSGVGFSASMNAIADAAPAAKARLGQLHFARAAVGEVAGRYLRRPPRLRVQAGSVRLDGVTAVVQNAAVLTYFGPRAIRVCAGAGLDTGTLGMAVLDRFRAADLPGLLGRLLVGSATGHPRVHAAADLEAAVITPADGHPLPLEADGEYLGEHVRIEYGVLPGALRVVA